MLAPLVLATDNFSTAVANAPPPSPELDVPAKIRSGIVIGLELGGGLGGASGYPNAQSQINQPQYFSSSGFMGGSTGTLFVMGALADYLNFGLWFGSTSYQSSDWRSSGGAGGLRVEAFPLVKLFPPMVGLGILGDFGIGKANLVSTKPDRPEASGTQSFIGFGPFYEWSFWHVFGGHFGAGPALEYDAMWSQPFERHGLLVSGRVVFYGGP